MRTEYFLRERQKQERGVFLTFSKLEIPDNWWDKLWARKTKTDFVKVFYPLDQFGAHIKTDMAYVPSGAMVLPHEWVIFNNLLNMKDAENEPSAKVEKIYIREPFKCKEGWVKPEEK
jgi:hypothetical protein